MSGHFAASFAALGMPPFFVLILQQSLHSEALHLAGWFYVAPPAFAALSSPWWGRLADRYGKRNLLIRAHLGLAASFLLAGFATHTWTFFAALILQGLLGGTFAASNAYLATIASGPALVRGLTAMQWSARAALVVAPVALGIALDQCDSSPIEVYRYLSVLPLAAAVLAACLPRSSPAVAMPFPSHQKTLVVEASACQIYAMQFLFVAATVVTFPYFSSYVLQEFEGLSTAMAGLLFGLPHAAYLVLAMPMTNRLTRFRKTRLLAAAFAALAASLIAQAMSTSVSMLSAWRIVMGLAMTAALISLHSLVAAVVHDGNAGKAFGWFESSAKWGAVAAGLAAGLVVEAFTIRAPLLLGAALAAVAAIYLMHPLHARRATGT